MVEVEGGLQDLQEEAEDRDLREPEVEEDLVLGVEVEAVDLHLVGEVVVEDSLRAMEVAEGVEHLPEGEEVGVVLLMEVAVEEGEVPGLLQVEVE